MQLNKSIVKVITAAGASHTVGKIPSPGTSTPWTAEVQEIWDIAHMLKDAASQHEQARVVSVESPGDKENALQQIESPIDLSRNRSTENRDQGAALAADLTNHETVMQTLIGIMNMSEDKTIVEMAEYCFTHFPPAPIERSFNDRRDISRGLAQYLRANITSYKGFSLAELESQIFNEPDSFMRSVFQGGYDLGRKAIPNKRFFYIECDDRASRGFNKAVEVIQIIDGAPVTVASDYRLDSYNWGGYRTEANRALSSASDYPLVDAYSHTKAFVDSDISMEPIK